MVLTKRSLVTLCAALCLVSAAWPETCFDSDPNCVAAYLHEGASAGTAVDSVGGNNLTFNFSGVGFDSNSPPEGSQSRGVNASSTIAGTRSDGDLDAGFPGKGGGAIGNVSITCWFKINTHGNYAWLASKHYNTAGNQCGYGLYIDSSGDPNRLNAIIPYGAGGDSLETFTEDNTDIVVGRWFHVGFTYSDTDKSWRIRIYDQYADSVVESTGTGTQTSDCSTQGFYIFNKGNWVGSQALLGWMDETVIFNDILTADEIDDIRLGVYGDCAASGNDWWWRRRQGYSKASKADQMIYWTQLWQYVDWSRL